MNFSGSKSKDQNKLRFENNSNDSNKKAFMFYLKQEEGKDGSAWGQWSDTKNGREKKHTASGLSFFLLFIKASAL